MSKELKEKDWKNHISLWKGSGLSISKYCENNNLIAHRFYYWKRRFIRKPDISSERKALDKRESFFSKVVAKKEVNSMLIRDPIWLARFLREFLK